MYMQSFHSHFSQLGHNGMADWQFMLIDSASDTNTIRRKESFWQFNLIHFGLTDLMRRMWIIINIVTYIYVMYIYICIL